MKDFQDWPWWLQTLVYFPLALAFYLAFSTLMEAWHHGFSQYAQEWDAWRMTDQ